MPDKLLTTRELVDMLQLDRVTIYKMVKDGELPSLRVGGQWRFSEEAIGAWLRGRRGETYPRTDRRCPGTRSGTAQADRPGSVADAAGNSESVLRVTRCRIVSHRSGRPTVGAVQPLRPFLPPGAHLAGGDAGLPGIVAGHRSIGRRGRGRSHLPCRHPVRQRADQRRRPTPGYGDGRTIPDGTP